MIIVKLKNQDVTFNRTARKNIKAKVPHGPSITQLAATYVEISMICQCRPRSERSGLIMKLLSAPESERLARIQLTLLFDALLYQALFGSSRF